MENDNRQHRLKGRAALRNITTDMRCFDCGREPIGTGVAVRRTPEGVVGFAGLATCGRIWLCPVCNSKVMAKRAIEIGVAIAWARRESLHLIWGSLTVRHNARSDLAQMLDMQRAAWRRVVRSKVWARHSATTTVDHICSTSCGLLCDRKRETLDTGGPGRVGYIRASELTIGANGWHPHFHPLIVYRGTASEAQRLADAVVREWVYAVEAEGGEARQVGGQLLRVLAPSESFEALTGYVTKQTFEASASSLALELVWSQGKVRRSKGRAAKTESHWSLLAEIAAGLADSCERWWQLEEAVPGHRMITWSRGLRRFAGLGVEATDEEEAAREVGSADDTVCFLTPAGWDGIRDNPDALGLLLSTLESSGWAGLRVVLDGLSVEYFTLSTV